MIRIIKTKKVEKIEPISFIEKEKLRKNDADLLKVGIAKMKNGVLKITIFNVRSQSIIKIRTYKVKKYHKKIGLLSSIDVMIIDRSTSIYPAWFRVFLRNSDFLLNNNQYANVQNFTNIAALFAHYGINVRSELIYDYEIKVGRSKMFMDETGAIALKVNGVLHKATGGSYGFSMNKIDRKFIKSMDIVAVNAAFEESNALAAGFPILNRVGRTFFTFKKEGINHLIMLQLGSKNPNGGRTATLTHFTYLHSATAHVVDNIIIDIDHNKMTNIYKYLKKILKDVDVVKPTEPTMDVVDDGKGITAKELAECVIGGLDEKDESNAFFTGYTPQRLFNATDTNLQFPPALVPQGLAGMMLEIKTMGDSLLESIKNDSPINPSLRNIEVLKAYGKTLGVDMKLTEASRFAMLNQAKEAEDVESPEIETTITTQS